MPELSAEMDMQNLGKYQRQILDKRFKDTGVENVYLPMLIPENSASERSGSRRRIRSGSCMGDTWRNREITGKICDPSDIRDTVL